MKIEEYISLKEAIESLIKRDKDYVFVRHTLDAGEAIKPHCHPKANEFLVVDSGVLDVRLDWENKVLTPNGRVIVIHFPKRKKHSLKTLTPISYFVFRDREDETIYCEET